MAQAPELPTIAELGYAGFDVGTWFGIWGPAGMQTAVAEKINAAVAAISKLPEIRELLLSQGMNVIGSSTAELATYQQSESERWAKVIKTANIKLD
jgi:tripartite-type tricarboxylate transporter receptor subunit TctC